MGWAWASLTSASDLIHTTSIWSTWQTQQGGTWALHFLPQPRVWRRVSGTAIASHQASKGTSVPE